jgi:hypothetical protein
VSMSSKSENSESEAQNTNGDASTFAPVNPLDGREIGQWESRYGNDAKKLIRFEAWYLITLFFLSPLSSFALWMGWPNSLLHLPIGKYDVLCRFSYVVLGGLLGGTLFGMKWLYHGVAKGIWNIDRRLWRLLSPLISAGLAFAIGVLIASSLFGALDPKAIRTASSAYAIGFLVGYFSDSALAKLAEIARSLFGPSERHTTKGKAGPGT